MSSLLKYFNHFLLLIDRLAKEKNQNQKCIIELKGITNQPSLIAFIAYFRTQEHKTFF